MSIVRTVPWSELISRLRENRASLRYAELVEFILASDYFTEIHGGPFLSGFLVSDAPDFTFGEHMIRVVGVGRDEFEISYYRGLGYPKDAAHRICSGEDLISNFSLFSKKFLGVDLKMKKLA